MYFTDLVLGSVAGGFLRLEIFTIHLCMFHVTVSVTSHIYSPKDKDPVIQIPINCMAGMTEKQIYNYVSL